MIRWHFSLFIKLTLHFADITLSVIPLPIDPSKCYTRNIQLKMEELCLWNGEIYIADSLLGLVI